MQLIIEIMIQNLYNLIFKMYILLFQVWFFFLTVLVYILCSINIHISMYHTYQNNNISNSREKKNLSIFNSHS